MQHILLVEDDPEIARYMNRLLLEEGFSLTVAGNVREGTQCLNEQRFDLLLLDISLPDGSGYSLCTMAKKEYQTPVIFLTASGDEYSVVTGLDLGADDYVSKPFRPRELVSRIRSVLRRTSHASQEVIGSLVIDQERGIVTRAGEEIPLSALEYRLLLLFVNNRGTVLTRNRILEEVWDASGLFVNDNTLSVYIGRLRDKIEEDPQNPALIQTVRGLGYRMV